MKKIVLWLSCILTAAVLFTCFMLINVSAADKHGCEKIEGIIKTEPSIQGSYLVATCAKCETYVYQRVSIDLEDGTVFCEGKCDVSVRDAGWSDVSPQTYIVLYEGDGNTEYDMTAAVPDEPGEYTVFLTYEAAWEMGSENVREYRTTPVHFTIREHDWSYSHDTLSVFADCKNCGEHASATLDEAAVSEAVKYADPEKVCDRLVNEVNWNNHGGIKPYVVIYNGTGTDDNGKTVKYTDSVLRPEYPGSYTAKLRIPEAVNDLTDNIETYFLPFYISGIPLASCEVRSLTAEEIAALEKPQCTYAYYVRTAEELLWCAYNQTADMEIYLLNDIIFNPLIIDEDGIISSGSETVYIWPGFGTSASRYSGKIHGQGHTIYGLYFPENRKDDKVSGFICWGKNVQITDLTIAHSYFSTTYASGAFVGELQVSGETVINGCNSLNNSVNSDSEAGGFIGWVAGTRDTSESACLKIENCVNNSLVTANCAGGFIGKTNSGDGTLPGGSISKCYNHGKITGSEYGAGITGLMTIWHHIGFEISDCLNAGYVKADRYESGIVAQLNTDGSGGALKKQCVVITGNVNIGELYYNCRYIGEIIANTGNTDYYDIGLLKLENNYISNDISAYPSSLTNAPKASELTRSQIKNGGVCEIMGGHVKASEYSGVTPPTCEAAGYKNISCMVCGLTLETVKMNAHGHYTVKGKCIYCGESNPEGSKNLGASVFSSASRTVIVSVAAALAAAAVAVILLKNRKKNAAKEK